MNLAVDFGNTTTKAAIFEHDEIKIIKHAITVNQLKELIIKYNPENIIVSSVTKSEEEIKPLLRGQNLIFLSDRLPIPFNIKYNTPETLGLDRIAAVAGAQHLFPNENCLVIDIGTCITYDLLDRENIYHGGAISPGLSMRFRALHNFTANLPLIEPGEEGEVPLIGKSTKDSILSGVINGMTAEITEIIRMYNDKCANLRIIMCGGDTKFFENRLKAGIFAAPELVLRGLNRILLYNV